MWGGGGVIFWAFPPRGGGRGGGPPRGGGLEGEVFMTRKRAPLPPGKGRRGGKKKKNMAPRLAVALGRGGACRGALFFLTMLVAL